jgi:transcriptional regulator with XRE-family HTH domain
VKNQKEIEAFGKHLRKLREDKGYSQQELADMADIAKITVQRIELAKYTATLDVMISLAKALEISLPELTDFKVKRKKF